MKKILPLLLFTFTTLMLSAQCSELFISEYVEGYGNNRALEIYNPTNAAIDLSEYSVGRFSNGGTSYVGIALSAEMIQPYETYVIVLDKRDSLGSGLELPVWNGYQLWDYCIDELNGDTITNMEGDTIYCVQYINDGALPLYGTQYNEWLDLQGKANEFACPVYNVNNAMYFNGNDAVALVKGTTVEVDGSNIIDVIGVIGDAAMADNQAWVDASGGWLTRDHTLSRKADITMGTGAVVHQLQDTFEYVQYDIYRKNYFDGMGSHECICETSATQNLNQVAFKMFPNPVSENLVIEAEENIEQVEIYNLLGQRVLIQNFGNDANNKINLSVGKFDIGMYTISLHFEDDRQSIQKFIKQ